MSAALETKTLGAGSVNVHALGHAELVLVEREVGNDTEERGGFVGRNPHEEVAEREDWDGWL